MLQRATPFQIGCFTLCLIMVLGLAAGVYANAFILLVLLAFPAYFGFREYQKRKAARLRRAYQEQQLALQIQRQKEAERLQREAAERARIEYEQRRLAAQQLVANTNNLVLGPELLRRWNPYAAAFEQNQPDFLFTYLTPAHLTRHLVITAPTRAGKTFNLIRPLISYSRYIRAAAIFFDPKGDDFDQALFDLNFSMQAAERSTTIKLCIIDPKQAATNPLQACRKLAEALIPQAKEPFYSDAAREAMAAFMFSHYVVLGKLPELSQVLAYSGSDEARQQIGSRLKEIINDPSSDPQARDQADDALNLLNVAESRSKAKGELLGSLYNALLPLATGQFKKYVTTDPTQGVTVRQMLDQRLITRIAFTSDEGEIGKALGKIVVQQFTDAVLSPTIDKSYLKLIVIDEAHNYVCEALKKGTAQAAGNNAGYILAFQSLRQIENEDMRIVIRDNCKNKVVLAGVGFEDGQDFSRFFGETELPYYSYNQGQSQGQSQNVGQNTGTSVQNETGATTSSVGASSGRGTNQGTNQGQSQSYQRRPIWLPSEITNLARFHAVMFLDDGQSQAYPHYMRFLDQQEGKMIDSHRPPEPARHAPELAPGQYLVLPASSSKSKTIPDAAEQAAAQVELLKELGTELHPISQEPATTPAEPPPPLNPTIGPGTAELLPPQYISEG